MENAEEVIIVAPEQSEEVAQVEQIAEEAIDWNQRNHELLTRIAEGQERLLQHLSPQEPENEPEPEEESEVETITVTETQPEEEKPRFRSLKQSRFA